MRKIGNSDFSTNPTNLYNLDVIISVGYRVNPETSGIKYKLNTLQSYPFSQDSQNLARLIIKPYIYSKL